MGPVPGGAVLAPLARAAHVFEHRHRARPEAVFTQAFGDAGGAVPVRAQDQQAGAGGEMQRNGLDRPAVHGKGFAVRQGPAEARRRQAEGAGDGKDGDGVRPEAFAKHGADAEMHGIARGQDHDPLAIQLRDAVQGRRYSVAPGEALRPRVGDLGQVA